MSTVKQRSGELWVLGQARRLGVGKNTLRRRSDRIEAVVLWCGLVVALLLIPVAAAVGTGVGNASAESAARQRAVLHEVKATTLQDTANAVPSAPGDVLSRAMVSYVDANGVAREGMTSVVIGTKAGDEVTIWLDRSGAIAEPVANEGEHAIGEIGRDNPPDLPADVASGIVDHLDDTDVGKPISEMITILSGNIAPTPRSGADSSTFGGTVGFLTLTGSWLLLWGLVRLARVPLDRRRAYDWESEWRSVAPRWLRGQK